MFNFNVKPRLWLFGFLTLVYLFLFSSGSYKNFFVTDDFDFLYAFLLRNISPLQFAKEFMMRSFTFRPLGGFVSSLCYKWFFLTPSGYIIITGIIPSIFNIMITYQLIRRIVRDDATAFLGAFLFSISLVQFIILTPFTYTALAFFFFSLSLLTYILSLEEIPHKTALYLASLGCYMLSLLTKEDAISLPFFILAYHIIFDRSKRTVKSGWFFLLMFLYFIIRFFVLGLWIVKQDVFVYNFYNIRNVFEKYTLFTLVKAEWLTYAFSLFTKQRASTLGSISLYHYAVTLIVGLIVILCIAAAKKKRPRDFGRNGIKLFFLGLTWYAAGLLPFVFITNPLRFNSWYLYMPSLGFVVSLAVGIAGLYELLSRISRYVARFVIGVLVSAFFLSSLLAVSGNVTSQTLALIYMTRNTKKMVGTIRSLYKTFPDNSRIYLVGFPELLRMHLAILIFYNNPRLDVIYVKEGFKEDFKPGKNEFVIRFTGNWHSPKEDALRIEDISESYKK
ncbi:MAG: hypothetical protein V1893_00630 [Candidatus Omnitrophota bacterium]